MENKNKKVAVHFADGFEEIEALATVDILRRADIETIMVSVAERKIVKGSHGISIICDEIFDDVNYSLIDMIILPGGMPGSKNLNEHSKLKEVINQFNDSGKHLAAICAAPMVYGNMGILKGHDAVCYPGFEQYLPESNIKTELVVHSGKFITAKGPGAAIEFGLKLVEILRGSSIENEVRKSLILA